MHILNERLGCKTNQVIILEIFKHLIDASTIEGITDSLTSFIMRDGHGSHNLRTEKQSSTIDFEIALITQEILVKLIDKEDFNFPLKTLRLIFPLSDIDFILSASLKKLKDLSNHEISDKI